MRGEGCCCGHCGGFGRVVGVGGIGRFGGHFGGGLGARLRKGVGRGRMSRDPVWVC